MPADNAVVVHERKRVFTGVVNLDELVVAEREPGHDTRTQRLLSLELPEAVALFLHDTERDTASVVIVSRPLLALDGSARDTWMFELPTETVRSGETTRQAAMRVGLEDLGTRLSDSDLTPIAVYHPISTLSAQRVTIFYATQTAEMLVGPAIADRQ